MTTNTDLYRTARDQLVDVIGDYDKAVEAFSWPQLTGAFNWATDWFDVIAHGNERTALWIVEEDGEEHKISFAEMADASDRVATWLGRLGVGKGDRVMLMLGNQVELWESMLAVMKLGAVIMPTTTAVGTADLVDRIARGRARHVICNAVDVGKFDEVPGDYTRISVGVAEGWADLSAAVDVEHSSVEHPGTAPGDPLLLYFTSGTTSRPKLVEHTQVS
jgi:acetyl-CoA synthetase